jgi:hypothetical protein
VWSTLDNYHGAYGISLLILGGARGIDKHAQDWAIDRRVSHMVLYADWDAAPRYAGPLRNQRMIDEGRPHACIAFAGGRGTKDMRTRCRKAGVPVLKIVNRE